MAEKLEGCGISQLQQMIKRIGHNNDFTIELATVTKPLPDLSIKIDGMNIELPKEFLMVCENVYERGFIIGDRVLVSSIDDGQTFLIYDRVVML